MGGLKDAADYHVYTCPRESDGKAHSPTANKNSAASSAAPTRLCRASPCAGTGGVAHTLGKASAKAAPTETPLCSAAGRFANAHKKVPFAMYNSPCNNLCQAAL